MARRCGWLLLLWVFLGLPRGRSISWEGKALLKGLKDRSQTKGVDAAWAYAKKVITNSLTRLFIDMARKRTSDPQAGMRWPHFDACYWRIVGYPALWGGMRVHIVLPVLPETEFQFLLTEAPPTEATRTPTLGAPGGNALTLVCNKKSPVVERVDAILSWMKLPWRIDRAQQYWSKWNITVMHFRVFLQFPSKTTDGTSISVTSVIINAVDDLSLLLSAEGWYRVERGSFRMAVTDPAASLPLSDPRPFPVTFRADGKTKLTVCCKECGRAAAAFHFTRNALLLLQRRPAKFVIGPRRGFVELLTRLFWVARCPPTPTLNQKLMAEFKRFIKQSGPWQAHIPDELYRAYALHDGWVWITQVFFVGGSRLDIVALIPSRKLLERKTAPGGQVRAAEYIRFPASWDKAVDPRRHLLETARVDLRIQLEQYTMETPEGAEMKGFRAKSKEFRHIHILPTEGPLEEEAGAEETSAEATGD